MQKEIFDYIEEDGEEREDDTRNKSGSIQGIKT